MMFTSAIEQLPLVVVSLTNLISSGTVLGGTAQGLLTDALASRHLLLAAGDWVGALVPIVVIIIWVLNQVFAKINEAPKPPRGRPPQDPAVGGQAGGGNAPREDNIEAFLRRAAEVRAEREGAAQRPSNPQQRPSNRPRRKMPDKIAVETPVEVELVEEAPRRGLVDISQREEISSEPAPKQEVSEVQESVNEMKAHLDEVFGHDVGGGLKSSFKSEIPKDVAEDLGERLPTIEERRVQEDAAYGEKAAIEPSEIASLLSSPQGLRNAILMQEILRPRSFDI